MQVKKHAVGQYVAFCNMAGAPCRYLIAHVRKWAGCNDEWQVTRIEGCGPEWFAGFNTKRDAVAFIRAYAD